MIKIIEDWLFSQLGINFNLYNLADNNIFQDGCIFVDILQKYGLLNNNYSVNITLASDPVQCRRNLKMLEPIFDMLKVNYDEQVILGILESKGAIIIKLLYEMYICLENKQNLYFITNQNYEEIHKHFVKNLNIKHTSKNCSASDIPLKLNNEFYENPLIQNKDIIKWYNNKYKVIKNNLDVKLNKLRDRSNNIELEGSNQTENRCSCSYIRKEVEEEPLPNLDTFLKYSNVENHLTYDQFIYLLKKREYHNSVKRNLEKSFQNELIEQTWNKIMEKQNEIFNSIFSDILLKQSQYEKQILSKLIQTQQQIQIQSDNQIQTNKKLFNEHEKQINCDYELKEKFEELKNIYENEQKRVLELHRKLYKEKQDLIRKRHYNLCRDVIESIIDIAANVSEFKSKYGSSVPKLLWNNWMEMFFKAHPTHIPFQKLENEVLQSNIISYNDIINFEKEQDDILNKSDVDKYLFTCGQWFSKDLCIDYGDINENILAHIIYRLLSIKYPLPESPLPANLPFFKLAGVLLNFYNPECIEKLKVLLSKPGIHVFDSDTAVKKSIEVFQKETTFPIDEKSTSKEHSKQLHKKSKSKELKKTQKIKKEKKKEKTEILYNNEADKLINLIDKETQTSIIIDTDEKQPERTGLGLIGEKIFDILRNGEKLDDTLLVSVIIEYLKTLKDFEGWILLNYPLTLKQALVIELALTGKYLPVEDYILEENKNIPKIQPDEYSDKRMSRLLARPIRDDNSTIFKTHFTVFIKIKEILTQHTETLNKDYKASSVLEIEENEISTSKKVGNILPDILETFYKDQSVFQDFCFESCDLSTLKKLARTILKEDGVEVTDSVDLFGEESLRKLVKGTKKGSGPNKKLKLREKSKASRSVLTVSDQEKILESEEESVGINDKHKTESQLDDDLELIEIKPCNKNWQTIVLPINNEMVVILATVWENIENCYLTNLNDRFFENRIINLRLFPYSTYIQKEITKITNKSDLKQNLVDIFQNYYNGIKNNLRSLPEVKSQLHCKVSEMQQSLWEIADQRKNEAETKRLGIIQENWLVTEICLLINNYLFLVQTEFNRSLETLKLVDNYYLSMLDKDIPSVFNIPFAEMCVTKITPDILLYTNIPDELFSGKSEENANYFSSNSESFLVQRNETNFIAQSLTKCCEKENILYILNHFLSSEIEKAIERLQSISQNFYSHITTEETLLATRSKKLGREENSGSRKEISPKTNTEKSKKKTSKLKTVTENETKTELSIYKMLLKEWKFVVDTEIDRYKFRLMLIDKVAKENIMEFYGYLESVFCKQYNLILSKYNTDITNINNMCTYIKTAIEEESPLTEPLILNNDTFYVNIIQDLKRKRELKVFKELYEDLNECYFSINQLNKLKYIFLIAGPYGIIRKQPFCYIIQDLMLFNTGENQPHLPKIWNLLNESQLKTVIDTIFGPEYAIDWRDFIVYNLEIPYPTVDDILCHREQFLLNDDNNTEITSLENYENVKLWFERDLPKNPQECLRIMMIKNLLFDVFKVDDHNVNYTALLLYFCKDFDPILGLKKALSLALGKNVIMSKKEVSELLRTEAEIKEGVVTLLTNIINSIVNYKEGVNLYEISEIEENMSDSGIHRSYIKSTLSNSSSKNDDSLTPLSSLIKNESMVYSLQSDQDIGLSLLYHQFKDDISDKKWVSNIPVATVINVLNAALFHQDKTPLRTQYLSCLEEEADYEGMIEAYILVNLRCIQKLLVQTNKFKISSPCDILKQCLKLEQ